MLGVKFVIKTYFCTNWPQNSKVFVYLFKILIFSYFHEGRISTTLLAKEEKILKRIGITILKLVIQHVFV